MTRPGRRFLAAGAAAVLLATAGCTGGDEGGQATAPSERATTTASAPETEGVDATEPYAASLERLERDLPENTVHLELANAGSKPDQYAVVVEPPDVARVQPRMTREMQPGQRELVQLEVAPGGEPVTVTVRVRSRHASDELATLEVELG